MQELLIGYLSELNWTNGVTREDLMAKLVERDDALWTMVDEYVSEGTYPTIDSVMNVIPEQAWQDAQGDAWRGGEVQFVEDHPSHFQETPVGRDESEVYRRGGPPPPAPGFGHTSEPADAEAATTASAASGSGGMPESGNPGGGAGRIEETGTEHAGVWPMSGPLSGKPDTPTQGMASFGQGERGAAGYEDHGDSEVFPIPPDDGEPTQEPAS
jgi:hypothetical protein